jgi:hypothetical protein
MKNLALIFCSIRPEQLSSTVCDYRELEYYKTVSQLYRIIPESFDKVVVENTINHPEEIKNTEAREFFSELEIISLGSDSNTGTTNKGCGELLMLSEALKQLDLTDYENVSYVTGRRLWTCPYSFERTEASKGAVVVQNCHVYFNGTVRCNEKDNFNDTYFSMKTNDMIEYSSYSMAKMNYLSSHRVSSEINLYDFIHENNISYEILEWIGIVRNEWERSGNTQDLNNYHIC